jgi:hypothetical protein
MDIDVLTNFNREDNQTISIPETNYSLLVIAGGYSIIDNDLIPKITKYRWFADRDGYATTFIKEPSFKSLRLHQLVAPKIPNMVVDHRNHIRLDNRKSNLNLLQMREHYRKHIPDSTDIIYKQEELLQRGANYTSFKPIKEDITKFLKELK